MDCGRESGLLRACVVEGFEWTEKVEKRFFACWAGGFGEVRMGERTERCEESEGFDCEVEEDSGERRAMVEDA
jgi:hypothetical protein